MIAQPRSTQRYSATPAEDEPKLVQAMHELVRSHPRYGYRRIWALLRMDVPQKQKKRRRIGLF